jgi:osmotically-inducible protein OsmY
MGETQRPAADDHLPEVREPGGYCRADNDIAREIRERLADDVGLDASAIEIEVKGCEVTMRGIVRQCADAKRAEAHACAVSGVKIVRDELQSPQPTGDAATQEAAGAAAKMGKPTYER